MPVRSIPKDIILAAQETERVWGIPTTIAIAQWAIESAWGSKDMGCYNFFGIKARDGEPCVVTRTREVIGGKSVMMDLKFRAYGSSAEAFAAHGRLLARGTPYKRARIALGYQVGKTYSVAEVEAFADALTGVYATDPNYGKSLKAFMRGGTRYELNRGGKLWA